MVVTEAIKEAIWLHGLVEDLGIYQEHVSVFCDSQSAIYLAKNQVHHSRTKHIDVRFHFVREIIDEGDILLKKIRTVDNPADMMTVDAHFGKLGRRKKPNNMGKEELVNG